MKHLLALAVALWAVAPVCDGAVKTNTPANLRPGDRMIAAYFRAETKILADRCLADVNSLADWQAQREERRRQLAEMLGLWPMPERTDLKPVITGKLEQDSFMVEKLHFQASPGLYVTANLYLPKRLAKPSPAILYVCGHARVVTNGVSLGNKTGYQHHGAWFARNGYVCLVIDTVQLGEIEGVHHGTYRLGQWWWNSRGYTPAGVEAWCSIRALDYLCSRPEVDASRLGMTGRSGGGSYTWTTAALDNRVKVAAPIAGMTDLQNQVVDGCVEGHCDCMFFVNTYRWDFPLVAALIAPRPLLIGNSDKDTIFPLDGVQRLHEKVRRIYQLYGASTNLGLLITEGPHKDTQDLQLPVFRWFNRFLKGEDPVIEMAATKLFAPEQLKVFGKLPTDEVNTKIQEWFVPKLIPPPAQPSAEDRKNWQAAREAELKEKAFGGWPQNSRPLELKPVFSAERAGVRLQAFDFESQPHIRLRLYVEQSSDTPKPDRIVLKILDEKDWERWLSATRPGFAEHLREEIELISPANTERNEAALAELQQQLLQGREAVAWFAPRGIGLSAWTTNAVKAAQIRRRFMLLGQTLDSMRVWDVRRALQAIRALPEFGEASLSIQANRQMAVNALYASFFEPSVTNLDLGSLPQSHTDGPDYLNVLRVWDLADALALAQRRGKVTLR